MLIKIDGDMVKDIELMLNKNDPVFLDVCESFYYEDLEWLLENNTGRWFVW